MREREREREEYFYASQWHLQLRMRGSGAMTVLHLVVAGGKSHVAMSVCGRVRIGNTALQWPAGGRAACSATRPVTATDVSQLLTTAASAATLIALTHTHTHGC